MNKVKGRVPIVRLEQNLEYLGLEQLSKYLMDTMERKNLRCGGGNMWLTFCHGTLLLVIFKT